MLAVNAAMLEACVLAVLSREDAYGYRLTQELTEKTGVSESTLYPVLRRLQKSDALSTYDINISGRNRRYYRLNPTGRAQLEEYRKQWVEYKAMIDSILSQEEETTPEGETKGGERHDPS